MKDNDQGGTSLTADAAVSAVPQDQLSHDVAAIRHLLEVSAHQTCDLDHYAHAMSLVKRLERGHSLIVSRANAEAALNDARVWGQWHEAKGANSQQAKALRSSARVMLGLESEPVSPGAARAEDEQRVIYVAEQGCYENRGFAGAFTTLELAKAAFKCGPDGWRNLGETILPGRVGHGQERWTNGLDWDDLVEITPEKLSGCAPVTAGEASASLPSAAQESSSSNLERSLAEAKGEIEQLQERPVGLQFTLETFPDRLRELAQYAADGPQSPMLNDMVAMMREAADQLSALPRVPTAAAASPLKETANG